MPPTKPLRHEYRVVLPMKVDEYQRAQLYCVAEASKDNTGGGEGIEVLVNEPFDLEAERKDKCQSQEKDNSQSEEQDPRIPDEPLRANGQEFTKGQYTHKIYHLDSKVPAIIRVLAPKGSLQIHERAWNAYPYCRTIVTNPGYMKENFFIKIETMHYPDRGQTPNIHGLCPEDLEKRNVDIIDIARDAVSSKDYKKEYDPKLFKSEKTGRGPLTDEDWIDKVEPVMCAYKLVSIKFKWWGLQNKVEKIINSQEKRLFTTFHRQVFCQTDLWYDLTMEDIRKIEEETKEKLDLQRRTGSLRGMKADD